MKDIKGDEVSVGDTVAVARRTSTQATMRVGVVHAIDGRVLSVEWLAGKHLPESKITDILYSADKIVRL